MKLQEAQDRLSVFKDRQRGHTAQLDKMRRQAELAITAKREAERGFEMWRGEIERQRDLAIAELVRKLEMQRAALRAHLFGSAGAHVHVHIFSIIIAVLSIFFYVSISEKLADLNFQRFQNFKTNPKKISSKAAAFAFNGDTYIGLSISEFSELDLNFSQKHLRILSGLYGLLRPLDIIQPYRLEMGSHLKNKRGNDLYDYWSNTISEQINLDLKGFKNQNSN